MKRIKSTFSYPVLIFLIMSFCFFGFFVPRGFCADTSDAIDTMAQKDVYILVGELQALKVYSLTRLSMVDPDVADIANAEQDSILVVGQEAGETALFIWDEKGKRSIIIHVLEKDLERVQDRLNDLFISLGLHEIQSEINENEGKIILTGSLPEEKMEKFETILEPYEDLVINLVEKEQLKDLIRIDMQITELSNTLTKNLGVDWSSGSSDGGIVLTYEEDENTVFDGSIGDFFKVGDFRRTTALMATVQAMIAEGKGRVLSKPRLIVSSGEEANFLVGGEIPIRTAVSSDGNTEINVTYKEYGVSFAITPTIKKVNDESLETQERKIDIVMNLEISDIDSANAVGDDVAFNTRSVNTRLFLDNRQPIIMAGLIKRNQSELVKRVPFVSNIPVLGLLFKSRTMPSANTETELVISLTPTILDDQKDSAAMDSQGSASMQAVPGKAKYDLPDLQPRYLPGYQSPPPQAVREYARQVKELVSRGIVYPKKALENRWEGTVKLEMLILDDGTLAFVYVKHPSEYKVLDEAALAAAKKISSYPKLPPGIDQEEVNLVIPIVYSLANR